MRTLLFVLMAVSFVGCASIERFTSPDGKTRTERKQDRDAFAAQEAMKQDIKPGMSLADFKSRWDEPDRTEFIQGYYVLRYDNEEEPIDFFFKDDKLTQWTFDDSKAAEYKNDHFRNRALASQQEDARKQRLMNVIGAMRSVSEANKTHHCVTQGAYTNCN